MSRLTLIITGLVSLVLGMVMMAPSVAADGPLTARTLVNQRVELLSQEPLCWNVLRATLPPGGRAPADFHVHALNLSYRLEGTARVEYAGGPSPTYGPGTGNFIGNNNWHVHVNAGTTPINTVSFELTCQRVPPVNNPVTTHITKTDVLPGIRPMAPYFVQFAELTGPPGNQGSVHSHPGPKTYYVHEGTVAYSTPEGVKQYSAGAMWVIPPETPYQVTNVGTGPTRMLLATLVPADGPAARLLPEVRLPSATPAALPRTGDGFPWAGPLAMLVGALLLAAGIGLRRRQA